MRDMFMDGWDWTASVAMLMLMLLMILLMLLVQYLQTNKAWRLLEHWHATTKERQQRLSWHTEENRELKSALRAEKAHVEQLQRKVEILQALLP